MNGSEFLRRLKQIARRDGRAFWFDVTQGKGSHGTVHLGGRSTTLKDRKKEISKGLLRQMLKDLDIDPAMF